ncbi:hypothetical protein E4T56_gene11699 [Termitomyces sp. T112]|nr:hypothetical protein E4T56_gene11699 [Termitomyces sp. T112]
MTARELALDMSLEENFLVVGSRYITAAGVVVLLYNHLLTFDDEVKYIWSARWSTPKLLFLVLRYALSCSILWHNYQLSMIGVKHLSNGVSTCHKLLSADCLRNASSCDCKSWFISAVCICIATAGPTNFFVMLRLWLLSHRDRRLVLATLCTFFLTETATLACAIAVIIKMASFIKPLSFIQNSSNLGGNMQCILQKRNILWILFAPGMIFETFGLVAIFLQSLRTYKRDKTEFRNMFCINTGGELLLMYCLTTGKLLGAIFIPLPVAFDYLIFLWCATTVLVTQMILQLRRHGIVQRELEVCIADDPAAKGRDTSHL